MLRSFLGRYLGITALGLAALMHFQLIECTYAKSNPPPDISELHSFSALLHYVADGDSFVVRKNGSEVSIRLWGIDAPEFDQPFSQASKNTLKDLLSGKYMQIIPKDIDRYGRIVAVVNIGNITVNSALVESGSAWVHQYYCKEPVCEYWYELEEKARNDKSGLWRGKNVIEPWVWKMKK
jgi:endonuclease YncB( thermonuclease family)